MERIVRTIGVGALVGWLASSAISAQEPQGAGTTGPRFRSGVDLVALSVVVTDGQGKFVGGLSADTFTVIEDGVAQKLSFFASMPVPIDLALLLDTSASMTDKLQTVQQAAIAFTSRIGPGNRISVSVSRMPRGCFIRSTRTSPPRERRFRARPKAAIRPRTMHCISRSRS
jgi:hypothetical protein